MSKSTLRRPRPRWLVIVASFLAVLGLTAVLSGCNAASKSLSDLNAELKGTPGTMRTFNQSGGLVDEIRGESFAFSRDAKFDSTNSEGGSNGDSGVVAISLGDQVMYHVGSTLVFAQDGLIDVGNKLPKEARFSNADEGSPWLNKIRKSYTDLWQGKAYTLMIRSQDGTPIAVYSGDDVTMYSTDLQKSTIFMVDGKRLLVYRADYALVPNKLLDSNRG